MKIKTNIKKELLKTILITMLALFGLSNSIKAQSNTVDEVKIGEQIWMVKNIEANHFINGNLIPEAKTEAEWRKAGKAGKPVWCYYNYDTSFAKKYGKMYNWFAVHDARGLAPKGYHIPSVEEWKKLEDYLADDMGKKLMPKTVNCSNCTNESGFTALPDAYCYSSGVSPSEDELDPE